MTRMVSVILSSFMMLALGHITVSARDAVQSDLEAAQGKSPQLDRGKIGTKSLNSSPSPDAATGGQAGKPKSVRSSRSKRRVGSSTPPGADLGQDNRQSQRGVCQSQCNLQRMSCDQGRNGLSDGFQNRSDQLRAAQSSCYLAIQGCLSRC